jgi:hypothetical protein
MGLEAGGRQYALLCIVADLLTSLSIAGAHIPMIGQGKDRYQMGLMANDNA